MKKLIALSVILLISGCATSNIKYTQPEITKIQNQVTINEDFDVVWNRLVKNLSSDFFVINNIEKASRIINVSFSTSKPSEYVNCGKSVREFSNARGKKVYEYDPSEATRYTFTNDMGHMFNAVRSSKLSGRANIYLAPTDNGTELSVNTKYVVDVDIQYYNANNQSAGSNDITFDFSTKSPYEAPVVDPAAGQVICVARGNLESRVIDYAM